MGMLLHHFSFCTWRGRVLCGQELYVEPPHRGTAPPMHPNPPIGTPTPHRNPNLPHPQKIPYLNATPYRNPQPTSNPNTTPPIEPPP